MRRIYSRLPVFYTLRGYSMVIGDLSTLAATLRREGFEARNLGQVGITIWKNGEGVFVSAEEISQFPSGLSARDVERMIEKTRRG